MGSRTGFYYSLLGERFTVCQEREIKSLEETEFKEIPENGDHYVLLY
jgi:S-ribosylhomocysteine lyase LuxS involved in autoinducer biosynthesis